MTEQLQPAAPAAPVDPKVAQAAADKAKAEALAVPAHASVAKDGQALAHLPHSCDLNTVGDAVKAHVAHRMNAASPGAKKPNWINNTHFRLMVHDILDPPTPEGAAPGDEPPADQRLIKVVVHREPEDSECEDVKVWNAFERKFEMRRTPKDASSTHDLESRVTSAASSADLSCKVVAIHRDGALIEFGKPDPAKPGFFKRLFS